MKLAQQAASLFFQLPVENEKVQIALQKQAQSFNERPTNFPQFNKLPL
jgi:hypothetical protein